jgi:hypothetical protein
LGLDVERGRGVRGSGGREGRRNDEFGMRNDEFRPKMRFLAGFEPTCDG